MIHKFWVVKSKFKLPGLAKTGQFAALKNASHALPKQRLTALFFVCAFVLATLLPVFVSVNEAQAASSKPKIKRWWAALPKSGRASNSERNPGQW